MKNFHKIVFLGVAIMLSGCMGNSLDFYKDGKPQADIKTYFNGPIKAWGIVQDWRGRVVSSFELNMVGSWEGDVGTLKEDFVYYDGKTQHRVWTITKLADGTYEGTASDILGKAEGSERGNAVNWHYTMNLPVGDSVYRIKFDDWMWQMKDGALFNRSYLKKFGITVAELTIFMQKQDK